MQIPKTPKIAQKVFPRLLWSIDTTKKEVYLTFDDGPTPEITPWVLRMLNKFNAKATFFCIGKNVVLYPDIFAEIVSQGHSVGNHTYNHLNAWKVKKNEYLNNVQACDKVFYNNLFRPPYGKLKPGVRSEILKNHSIVMWDILTYDFDNTISGEKCTENVLQHFKPGSIIVFHDSIKAANNLKYALPRVLEHFSRNDFSMRKL